MHEMLHQDLTEKIIGCYYTVYNSLGYGFLEKIYEKAMCMELRSVGLKVEAQVPIQVFYRGEQLGIYVADLVVEDVVIVEIKATEALDDAHQAQLLNYLRATPIEVGLLMNFGPTPKFFRRMFSNTQKGNAMQAQSAVIQ